MGWSHRNFMKKKDEWISKYAVDPKKKFPVFMRKKMDKKCD